MSPTSDTGRDLDRLDVAEVQRFLARRWKLMVATAVACAVLAGLVCLAMTPVYTATSQILLDPRKQHIFGNDAGAQDSALDSSIVDSQISIITSTRLLAKVIKKENLAEDPEFAASAKVGLLERLSRLFRGAALKKPEVPALDGIDPALAPVIVHLFNKVDVTRVAKTYVLSISVSSKDPAKATRLANSLASTYVEDQIDVHAKSVQQAASFFEERLGHLRDQVRQSESAVAAFRQKNNLTTTNMSTGTTVTVSEQQLQDLNQQLAVASTDTAEKLARYQQAARFRADGANLDTLPEIIRSITISQLRTQQADLIRREADLSAMYGPAYPAITQIRAQRAGYDRAIAAEIHRLVTTLRNDSEVAKAREDAMRGTIDRLSGVTGGDNETGVKLRELERTNMANKALFENFLNRAKLTQEASAFEEPDARLISPALEPSSPASPKTKLIVPVAGIAGLILGLGLAAGLDLRRRRPAPGRAAPVGRGDAFILARVPSTRTGADVAMELEARPEGAFARGIAALSDLLSAADASGRGRAVMLAPLAVGEGATSLALAVADVLGRQGRRVLLVDAGGGLSARLGLADRAGLAEVLAGTSKPNAAVVTRPFHAALPCGQGGKPPSAKALRAFVDQARSRFDLVLLDGPAFADGFERPLASADACEGIALVAGWDGMMRHDFVGAVDALAERRDFLGVILNRTAAAEPDDIALAS